MLDQDPTTTRENRIDPEYRGYVCARLLSTRMPNLPNDTYLEDLERYQLTEHESVGGELEYLGMKPEELLGKILDVGPGGGRSILQGLENGIDIYGIDVALKATRGASHPGGSILIREQIARDSLKRLIASHPDRIVQADAAVQIPFPDNSFDTVIACNSLPIYARNEQEAINSILEMIRVAREQVVFTTGYSDIPGPGEMVELGVGNNKFSFGLADFLQSLEESGIKIRWTVTENPDKKYGQNIASAHLDVTGKN